MPLQLHTHHKGTIGKQLLAKEEYKKQREDEQKCKQMLDINQEEAVRDVNVPWSG